MHCIEPPRRQARAGASAPAPGLGASAGPPAAQECSVGQSAPQRLVVRPHFDVADLTSLYIFGPLRCRALIMDAPTAVLTGPAQGATGRAPPAAALRVLQRRSRSVRPAPHLPSADPHRSAPQARYETRLWPGRCPRQ